MSKYSTRRENYAHFEKTAETAEEATDMDRAKVNWKYEVAVPGLE